MSGGVEILLNQLMTALVFGSAYSLASANYEDELEFFSIKVPDGPLTSQLQHLKEGDEIIISALEHHSNIVPWQMLCEEKGAQLKVAPVMLTVPGAAAGFAGFSFLGADFSSAMRERG